jgi:hypothetical protein
MKTTLIIVLLMAGFVLNLNAAATCFEWYLINQPHKIGLRNTCDDCKIAILSFNYNNGKHEEKEFKVAGHSSVVVDNSGTTQVQIIDQKDCK